MVKWWLLASERYCQGEQLEGMGVSIWIGPTWERGGHRGPTKYASRCLSRGLSKLGFSHLKCIKMLLFSSLWLGLLVFCLSQWFTYLFVPENQVSAHLDNHHHTHPSSVTLRSLLPVETELPCVFENKKEFACRDLGDTLTQCMSGRQPCVVIT